MPHHPPLRGAELRQRLRQRLRLLRPGRAWAEIGRVAAKLRRRISRPELRVAHLPALAPERGRLLFSYILDPFLLPADAALPHGHTHFWESREMATAWREAGYAVDAIHWTNGDFTPATAYDVCVDVRLNLERLKPLLPPSCLRVMHCETAHWRTNNTNQAARLARIEREHGVRIRPQKLVEENRAIESAQVATILGNRFTMASYAFAGHPIHRVPISTPATYAWPAAKDFARARRRFIWFGSGGLVHKGLDLVLEAFADQPELDLVVCGPVDRERDFEAAYWRELYATPNIHTLGWVDVLTPAFRDLCDHSLAVVFPSCSEGGGGGVITCMHAGLLPIVTPESSVDVDPSFGVELAAPTVEAIRSVVRELAARPPAELASMARASWEHARAQHTREHFALRYRQVVQLLLASRLATL
jgi:glycosyltransferase involved in cell wall biosynthesis